MKTVPTCVGLAVHARTIITTRQRFFRAPGLWTGFLAFATIALLPRPAQAAVIEAWVQRYSNIASNVADQAVKVVHDAAGDIIVTGTISGFDSQDRVTIKYSGADGSVLWQKRSSPGNARGLAVDGSGNVVVTGTSSDDGGLPKSSRPSMRRWTALCSGNDAAPSPGVRPMWRWTATAMWW